MSRLESSKQGYQFEKELVDSLNGESVNLNDNVRIAKEVVLDYYNDFEKAIHIGSETSNKLGDIEILSRNNKSNSLEVKYVDIGNGTYHNTSINYFNVRFGTPKYTDYLLQNGYKDEVSPLLEKSSLVYNELNSSPFTNEESRIIRKDKELYDKIKSLEYEHRKNYTDLIYEEVIQDENKLNIMIDDFVNKVTTKNDKIGFKGIPTEYLIFNKKDSSVRIKTSEEFVNILNNEYNIEKTDSGFAINNKLVVQLGWQNGSGLNNPTIRVFVKG